MSSEEDTGLTRQALYATFMNVFLRCKFAAAIDPPQSMGDETRAALVHACDVALEEIEKADGVVIAGIAAKVCDAYQQELRDMAPLADNLPPRWKDAPAIDQALWKTLVRHMANMLSYDAEEDGGVEHHEDRIVDVFFRPCLKESAP